MAVGRSRLLTFAVLMLALVAIAAAGVGYWYWGRLSRLEGDYAQQSLLLDRSAALLGEKDRVLSALVEADDDLSIAHLTGDETETGVTVFWNRRDGRSLLSAYGLPSLPRERVYALWVSDSSGQRIVTTFNTGTNGRHLSRQFFVAPATMRSAPVFLTVELASPGEVPNLPALLRGSFNRIDR